MPFAGGVECQLPNTEAHSGEVQLLMEMGDTKDDLKLPTFVKNENLAADDINNELKIEFEYRPHQLYAKVEAQQAGSHSKEAVSNWFKTRTRTTGVRSMRLKRSSRNSQRQRRFSKQKKGRADGHHLPAS